MGEEEGGRCGVRASAVRLGSYVNLNMRRHDVSGEAREDGPLLRLSVAAAGFTGPVSTLCNVSVRCQCA